MKTICKMMRFITITTLLTISMAACAQYKDFDEMATKMAEGDVPTIKSKEVNAALKGGDPLILLDAREQEEFDVSHIKNSKHVGYDKFDKSSVKTIAKDQKIVVYCSVGYRSCKIGEKLQKMGYTNVYNMYGGIFDWVNNGFSIVDNNGNETERIHSYNADWAKWLTRGKKEH